MEFGASEMIGVVIFAGIAGSLAVGWRFLSGGKGLPAPIEERIKDVLQGLHIVGTADAADAPTELFRPLEIVRQNYRWIADLKIRFDNAAYLIGGADGTRKPLMLAAAVGFLSGVVLSPTITESLVLSGFICLLMAIVTAVVTLRFLMRRARNQFFGQFPDAIDLIVRASKAGISVPQALAAVGSEIPSPTGIIFSEMADQLSIGRPMEETLMSAVERVPLNEFRFFAVTLILQRETGGQLSETLENLSVILRRRKNMGLKLKALTSEIRASAKVLSAIPFAIGLFFYFTNRSHIDLLLTHPDGKGMLQYSVISLALGLLIISKMSRIR